MRFGIGGAETLAIPGRSSGDLRKVPVIVADYAGQRYLVSTRGESAWVRNLRAAGGVAQLGRGGNLGRITTVEIPVEERGPIIEAYRAKAGRTVTGYWKQLPAPEDHPTFRIQTP